MTSTDTEHPFTRGNLEARARGLQAYSSNACGKQTAYWLRKQAIRWARFARDGARVGLSAGIVAGDRNLAHMFLDLYRRRLARRQEVKP